MTLSAREQELDAELQFHLDEEAAARQAAGLPPEEARRAARRDLGNIALVKESTRAAWGWVVIESWLQDLRYGGRMLRKAPVFAATVVLSLALGIGANTAIYSTIYATMFRTLPVENPHELVALEIAGGQSGPYFTNAIWESIRNSTDAFAGLAAYSEERFDISEGVESQRIRGLWVSGGYFDLLGVTAAHGRVLTGSDDRARCGTAGPVTVISDGFWRRQFEADPAVVGRTLRLNRRPFTIVGVAPPSMTGLNRDQSFDVALPIGCEPLLRTASRLNQPSWWLQIVGRMKPGATLSNTAARLNATAPEMFLQTVSPNASPEARQAHLSSTFDLIPCATGFSHVRGRYRGALFVLMAIAGLVLLIACANIANIMLARAEGRQKEISMRRALGASRWRLIRQLLIESLLLAWAGGCGGVLFAHWGGRALVQSISTANSPVDIDLTIDMHLLGFTAAIALLTAVVFGLVPALRATQATHATNGGMADAWSPRARASVRDQGRSRVGRTLATLQIAFTLVLLLAAGLFVGTFRNLLDVDLGFQPDDVLVVSVDLRQSAEGVPARVGMYDEILGRLRTLPGVRSASSSFMTPLGDGGWNEMVTVDGVGAETTQEGLMYRNRVSPGYFRTLGTPFLVGRDFDESEGDGGLPGVVINQSAAQKLFGSSSPLGKTIRSGKADAGRLYQVIGVVKDAKYGSVDEAPRMTMSDAIGPSSDRFPGSLSFELNYAGPVDQVTQAMRNVIADVSATASISFRHLSTQVDESMQQQRVLAGLSLLFGVLALSLAAVGLYGVTAYAAARRSAEIGIRIALGAPARSVVWLIVRDSVVALATGIALGVVVASASQTLVQGLLYGVAPNDPILVCGMVAILATATVLAASLPTWRTVRLAPARVFREQ
jgi:predicted permease